MLISCLRGHVPPASLTSFFTDAAGGYPGGVWYGSLRYVTARPATKALVTAVLLTGRPYTTASSLGAQQTPHAPQPLLHWVRRLRASLPLTDSDVALLTEQAGGGERQVRPLPPRGLGTGGLRREQAPVPCTPATAGDHTPSRELATTQRTASSWRPSDEGVTGRSPLSASPSRRMFSTAPAGRLIPLVPTRFTEIHISSAWREDDGQPCYPKRSRRPSATS